MPAPSGLGLVLGMQEFAMLDASKSCITHTRLFPAAAQILVCTSMGDMYALMLLKVAELDVRRFFCCTTATCGLWCCFAVCPADCAADCKPCLPKHLDTEACRATAYAQHLSCNTNKSTAYEVKGGVLAAPLPQPLAVPVTATVRVHPPPTAASHAAADFHTASTVTSFLQRQQGPSC
jgi:hypothetical protein